MNNSIDLFNPFSKGQLMKLFGQLKELSAFPSAIVPISYNWWGNFWVSMDL
jgi:hypothetical protein